MFSALPPIADIAWHCRHPQGVAGRGWECADMRVAMAAPVTAVGQKSFAFGYLEFDWDPNAPGGVPGFDS